VLKHGQMELNMKALTIWERNTDTESSIGLMDQDMKENFWTIIFMEKEFMNGQMEENMMEIGNKIKWMGKVFLHGQMEEDIKDNI